MASIPKIFFEKKKKKKLQFGTILLNHKMCVAEERTNVNKGSHHLNPYLLMVLLSIRYNELPCNGYLCT